MTPKTKKPRERYPGVFEGGVKDEYKDCLYQ